MKLCSGKMQFALALLASLLAAGPAPGQPFPSSTPLGNLSLASSRPGFPDPQNERSVWRDLDRLSTGVWSNSGDALQISVSVGVSGKGSVYLRALMDGQAAEPSDIELFLAGAATTSERSFTFIVPRVAAGFHLVRIQWLSGDSYTAHGRSLAVRSVPQNPNVATAQLQYAVPASGPLIHIAPGFKGHWSTIPGLVAGIYTPRKTNMQITFAAEMFVGSTRFIARALIDNATPVPGDITMEQQDHRSEGTRSVTFSADNVPAGAHFIAIQWYCDSGGDIAVGDRTLSVYAVDATRSLPDGGISSFYYEGAPETATQTDWQTLRAGVVDTGKTAASGVTISVSLEHLQSAGSGDVHIRAIRPDGTVLDPPEYILDKEPSFNTQTMQFATKDFPAAGWQFYLIQYKVDSGVTAQFRDHSIVSGAVRRTGADFAQAQPYQSNLYPHQGSFNVLTICLDPMRPGQPPLTDDVVSHVVDGSDGGFSIRGLYSEMSDGRWRMGSHTILGCGTPTFYHPPPEHQGTWYWDNGRFDLMRQDAIAAADADFQFKPFDLDGDGRVMANELDINICIPQTSTFGQAEEMGTYQVDGTTLKIETLDCYFGPNSDRNLAVGTIAHENSHQTLNAYDLYGPEIPPMPDKLTLMGDTNQPIHLSGYEKLHHGWIAPSVIDVTQWTTQTVRLDPIETSQQAILIYDPTRGHDDYFLIENRSTSTTLGITNYDSNIVGSAGLVLWHIVENPALLNPNIPPPVPCQPVWPLATSGCVDPALWAQRLATFKWVAGGIQNWGSIVPGQATPLVWSDGAAANMTVSGVNGDPSLVTIAKP